MKFRVGRYPIAQEAPLLEKIRADLPDGVPADGRRERRLHPSRARSRWARSWSASGSPGSRSRSASATATRATSSSRAALDIALAGGEILQSRERRGRAARPRRRRHRPARAGHLRRHRGDAVDRRPRRHPLDPGHAAHVEQRARASRPVSRSWPACPTRPGRPPRTSCSSRSASTTTRTARPPGDADAVQGRLGDDPRRSRARRRDRRGVPAPSRRRRTRSSTPPAPGSRDRVRGGARRGALAPSRRLPGARLCVEPDVTWLAGRSPAGGPQPRLRASRSRGDDGGDRGADRRPSMRTSADGGSLPTTWWLGPRRRRPTSTAPRGRAA